MLQSVFDKFCVVEILGSRGQVTEADRSDARRILDENVIVGEVRVHLDCGKASERDAAIIFYQFPDASGVICHNAVKRCHACLIEEEIGSISDTEAFCDRAERFESQIA